MTSEAPAKRPLLNLYIDKTAHGIWIDQPRKQNNDWFAIGGILIDQEQEVAAKQRLQAFLANWPQIKSPLHFTDTCAEKKGFAWLGRIGDQERTRFWSQYKTFLAGLQVAGTAPPMTNAGLSAPRRPSAFSR